MTDAEQLDSLLHQLGCDSQYPVEVYVDGLDAHAVVREVQRLRTREARLLEYLDERIADQTASAKRLKAVTPPGEHRNRHQMAIIARIATLHGVKLFLEEQNSEESR